MREERNKLLNFRSFIKAKDQEEQEIYKEMFYQSFKNDLERRKSDLEYQLEEIKNTIKLLEEIKKGY